MRRPSKLFTWLRLARRLPVARQIRMALLAPLLIGEVRLDEHGQIQLEQLPWQKYWASLYQAASAGISEMGPLLDALQQSWLSLIQFPGRGEQVIRYCHDYFQLLNFGLQQSQRLGGDWPAVMGRIVGFECFPILPLSWKGSALLVGTSTHRNPVYLLSRLRNPTALDETGLIPLVLDAQTNQTFYHYRQVKISRSPAFSLLLHLPVELEQRASGYAFVQAFRQQLTRSPEPRAKQRAGRLLRKVVVPLSEVFFADSHDLESKHRWRILDLGGGSGMVVRLIADHLVQCRKHLGKNLRVSITMVDVGRKGAGARFQRSRSINYSEQIRQDYRRWLDTQTPSPTPRFDMALLARLLGSLSLWEIGASRDPGILLSLAGKQLPGPGLEILNMANCDWSFLPEKILSSSSPRLEHLHVSPIRVRLKGGRFFQQLSLTRYSQALGYASGLLPPPYVPDMVCYPVRKWNPQALLTPSGKSVLAILLEQARSVVIEDPDVDQETLATHLRQWKLTNVEAVDMTGSASQQIAGLYCILPSRQAAELRRRKGAKRWKSSTENASRRF